MKSVCKFIFFVCVSIALSSPSISYSQNVNEVGISELFSLANRYLQAGDYRAAIPYLEAAVERTSGLTDDQGKQSCQTCRFQLARAQFLDGSISSALEVLNDYLSSDPRKKETDALTLQAKGFFDLQEWDKVESSARRLLSLERISDENEYDANLLLGQALYRQEKWDECITPLEFAAENTKDIQTINTCNIMVVGAMVKAERWSELYRLIPKLYRTDVKYDIKLNLTLMQAGKARYEANDLLNALLLYRMVLPRDQLISFTDEKISQLDKKLQADIRIGIRDEIAQSRQSEIDLLLESKETLIDLPAYEDEVIFRIGSIYSERNRFWEGFVLFDKLYNQDRSSDIGEAAMWQSVLVLYNVGEIVRAEERIIKYLEENPSGQYAGALLNLMMRDNYVKQEYQDVVDMNKYLNLLPSPLNDEDSSLQSELYYLSAFGHFQNGDYSGAGDQFTTILGSYPNSIHYTESRYYRGMTKMLQANYASALDDFETYRDENKKGEHTAASLFRQAVCQYGLENIDAAQDLFSEFIRLYPNDSLVSEAHSYRGDIIASREATIDLPNPLDVAILDYKEGISKAQTTLQSSYAAFKAAEVYKLEQKWEEIIDLMDYYLDLWEESANIAEATFWIGRSKIELGKIEEAINSYLDAINRFGDDVNQIGVDKIINELTKAASIYLDAEENMLLSSRIGIMSSETEITSEVLKIRLQAIQSMLNGTTEEFGKQLIDDDINISILSPSTLAILCDVLINYPSENEDKIVNYFLSNFEDSEQLWCAYRVKANQLFRDGKTSDLLDILDEVQGRFGADPYMGWAQLMKADTQFKLGNFKQAEKDYELITNIREWKGPLHAEAWFRRGCCREKLGELEVAHTFFQRTYLLFKAYQSGDWAAKSYLSAAKILQDLGKDKDAINTLEEMINDKYLIDHPLLFEAKEQLELL